MPDHAPIPEATSCGTDVPDYVGLAWRCGTLSIQRMGGMLAPLTLILKDGRQISPLYLAPWAAAAIRPELPPILQALRGEWPCVPFGSYRAGTGFPPEWAAVAGDGAGDPYLHGYGSNVAWEWARVDSTSVELRCRYGAWLEGDDHGRWLLGSITA